MWWFKCFELNSKCLHAFAMVFLCTVVVKVFAEWFLKCYKWNFKYVGVPVLSLGCFFVHCKVYKIEFIKCSG